MPKRARITQPKARTTTVRFSALLGLLLAAGGAGCGKPFNVKERVDSPGAQFSSRTSLDGVAIQAKAIKDENFLYDTFDANLIAAGVLPVRVNLTNASERVVDLTKAKFELRRGEGRAVKAVSPKNAFGRLMSYYGISLYNKSGYRESLETFSSYGVDLKATLEPRQSRDGLLFFLVPSDEGREAAFTLLIRGLSAESKPVEVKLD